MMHYVRLLLGLLFLAKFIEFNAHAQISFTDNFTSISNWTVTPASSWYGSSTCTNGQRVNLYNLVPSGSCYALTGTSLGFQTTVTFSYVVTNYSTGTATESNNFSCTVQSSSDGTTWTTQYTLSHTASTTCQSKTFTFTPNSGSLYLRFLINRSAGDFYFELEDLSVQEASNSCSSAPSAISSSSTGTTSRSLTWSAPSAGATKGYEYYYSTSSTTPNATTTPSGSLSSGNNTLNLSALSSNTTYYFWIRSICTTLDISAWSTVHSFTTPSNTVNWEGDVSTDWDTPGNWSGNFVPLSTSNVIIPSGTPFTCTIGNSSYANCNDLTINAGATIIVATEVNGLAIYGNLTNNGTIDHTGLKYIYLEGTNKTWGGSGTYLDCGIYIYSGATITLTTNTSIDYLEMYNSAATTLSIQNYYLTISKKFIQSGTVNMSSGTIEYRGNSASHTLNNSRLNEQTGIFYYNGITNNQTIKTGDYYDLKIGSQNTKTATIGNSGEVVVLHDLTIFNPNTAGGNVTTAQQVRVDNLFNLGTNGNSFRLNLGHLIYQNNGLGSFTMGNNANHEIYVAYTHATSPAFSGWGSPTFYGSVTYTSGSSQVVNGSSYYNLSCDGAGTRTASNSILVTNNFINNAGTFDLSTNSYSLSLKGNYTNNGTFNGRSSLITFSGTSSQDIGGSSASTFYAATVNNSSGITITKGPTISNALTITAGNITCSNNLEPIVIDFNCAVTGQANGKCVVGYLKKITNSTSKITLPIGSNQFYRPASITPSNTNTTEWLVKYFNVGHSDQSTVNTTGTLDRISTSEYWTIDRTGPADAIIELSWNQNSGISSILDVAVSHYNGTDWHAAGSVNANGTSSAGSVTTTANWNAFSPFTIGFTNSNAALPIELIGQEINCSTGTLNWSTASESNSAYYAIRHSEDGKVWLEESAIQAHGESQERIEYVYNIRHQIGYYQLIQIDRDGKQTEYTPLVASCKQFLISVYPNPTSGNVHINLPEVTNNPFLNQLVIFDLSGNQVYSQSFQGSEVQVNFNDLSLSSGYYTLKINTEDTIQMFPIVYTSN